MTANLPTHGLVTDIEIAVVDVLPGRRKLDPARVEALSDLFSSQGQTVPIEVIAQDGRYRLVFGGHRLALMQSNVDCPVLGEIGRDRCLTEQKEPFRATSRHRAQLFHACKSCPNRRQP